MPKCLAFLVPILLLWGSASAQDGAPESQGYPDREFDVALYVWGAELHGSAETGSGSSVDVDASFSDILDKLNIGVFAAGSGRIGRFVGIFDSMWLELEGERDSGTVRVGPIFLGPAHVDADIHEGMADLKFGYRILEPASGARQPVAIDLLAGGRYWYMHNEADLEVPGFADRHFSGTTDWIDPIVGVRVVFGLTPRLQFSAIGDVGGWSAGSASDHTYQVAGLLGVKLSEAWSLRLGYRVMNIERGDIDMEMRGPILGTVYRF